MERITRLPIASVKQNTGQIEGLPSNPRQWTQTDIDRIAKSLEETPELFEARPLIVYLNGADYVILGGNLRYEGAKKNKMKDVPVHILPDNLPIEKLKEIVVKDNGAFGAWDYDALANEWDDLDLEGWGVPAWGLPTKGINPDEFFEEVEKINAEKAISDEYTIEVVIPKEEEDLHEEIRLKVKAALVEYPNISVR